MRARERESNKVRSCARERDMIRMRPSKIRSERERGGEGEGEGVRESARERVSECVCVCVLAHVWQVR